MAENDESGGEIERLRQVVREVRERSWPVEPERRCYLHGGTTTIPFCEVGREGGGHRP